MAAKKITQHKILVLSSILLALIFMIPFSFNSPFLAIQHRWGVEVVKREIESLHEDFQVGTSSFSLSAEAMKKYGFADCTQFSLLLKARLANKGYTSRKVGLISSAGGAHDLLEVNIAGK